MEFFTSYLQLVVGKSAAVLASTARKPYPETPTGAANLLLPVCENVVYVRRLRTTYCPLGLEPTDAFAAFATSTSPVVGATFAVASCAASAGVLLMP